MDPIKKKFTLRPFDNGKYDISIGTTLDVSKEKIKVTFHLSGNISKIGLPPAKENPNRVIGLWHTTCFELFLRNNLKSSNYLEFNFSPTHDWNCFYFSRDGDELKEWAQINSINIATDSENTSYRLIAEIPMKSIPTTLRNISEMKVSTTAIINLDNEESFWAVKHTDNCPNFHHPESYTKLTD